jgi:hypothetical protein
MDRMEHGDSGHLRRDQAGIGPYVKGDAQLVPLGELGDVHVAAGDADVRGWDVCTLNGTKVGVVHELLVDRAQGEVVMLDVDLTGSNRHTLTPIRSAQIDRARRIVVVDSADLNGPGDVSMLANANADTTQRAARTETVPAARTDTRTDAANDTRAASATSADGVEETVVERRPVVYEEVVVRRRTVDPKDGTVEP